MTKPLSASDFAVVKIRHRILTGELKAGSRIQQHELASTIGVSHVPLREAIHQLANEGFVKMIPRRGSFVVALSKSEADEIFDLRVLLEGKALKLSIPNLTVQQLEYAKTLCISAEGITDPIEYCEINKEFHQTLYAGSNSPRLLSIIESLWRNASRYAVLLQDQSAHLEKSQQQHKQLLTLISNQETEKAVELLSSHILSTKNLINEYLDD